MTTCPRSAVTIRRARGGVYRLTLSSGFSRYLSRLEVWAYVSLRVH